MQKRKELTDAEVWAHPTAEGIFEWFNATRTRHGLPPLTRERATGALPRKHERERRWGSLRSASERKSG